MYGRLSERHEDECARHLATIDLLRHIKAGEVPIWNVQVNDDNTWEIVPTELMEAPDDFADDVGTA